MKKNNEEELNKVKTDLMVANARIKNLEEECQKKDEEIQSHKSVIDDKVKEVDSKTEFTSILQGRVNTLEEEKVEKDRTLNRYTEMMNKMHKEVKWLKENEMNLNDINLKKENDDLNMKLKQGKELVKKGAKRIDELEAGKKKAEENVADMSVKLGEEMNLRAEAESDYIKATNLIANLKELLEKNNEKNRKTNNTEERMKKPVHNYVENKENENQEKCLWFEDHGKCKFGDRCFKIHPDKVCKYFEAVEDCPLGTKCLELHVKNWKKSMNQDQGKSDCTYWLRGSCKFSDEECFLKYDIQKKGMLIKKKEKQSNNEAALKEEMNFF